MDKCGNTKMIHRLIVLKAVSQSFQLLTTLIFVVFFFKSVLLEILFFFSETTLIVNLFLCARCSLRSFSGLLVLVWWWLRNSKPAFLHLFPFKRKLSRGPAQLLWQIWKCSVFNRSKIHGALNPSQYLGHFACVVDNPLPPLCFNNMLSHGNKLFLAQCIHKAESSWRKVNTFGKISVMWHL